jgi:putative ABC transport system permease protein
VLIFERSPEAGIVRGSASPANVIEWREQARTLQDVVVMRNRDYTLTGDGPPERVTSYGVSGGFFDALGVRPELGRTFRPGEDEPGQAQVVVLRHAYWQTRFGGDPHIVGKRIQLDDASFEVIGVMPRDFEFPYNGGEMWTPFVFEPQMRQDHGGHYLRVLALLAPGATVEQAGAELRSISERIAREFPDHEAGHTAYAVALNDEYTRVAKNYIPVLVGSAAFVLLIACSNVANLLLARGASRRKEIAVRLALGASRWRLIRQLLVESVLLAVVGGVLGCLLAGWAIDAMSKSIPVGMAKFIPGWSRLGLSYTVLAFTAALSVVTGILFGLAPAWQATKADLNQTLKEGGIARSAGGRGLMRHALVIVEVALSLVLLVGAGLFVRTFVEILHADLGIDPEGAVTMSLELPREAYAEEQRRRDFFHELLGRVEALPGVTAAGAVDSLPLGGRNNFSKFNVAGRPAFEKGKEPYTQVRIATPGYFAAVGTDLRAGRLFAAEDDAQAVRVVLVNEAFAARYLADADPVGRRVVIGDAQAAPLEVAGVVANVMNEEMDDMTEPCVYLPFAQVPTRQMNLVVRAPGAPSRIVSAVRDALAALDPRLPLSNIQTMEQVVHERRSPKVAMMWTLVVFAVAALVMAAVGTYAVMAYAVAQRTHEIGVRMALGAQSADVLRLMLGRGLKLVLVGVAIGLAVSLAFTRLMASLLYGVSPTDPLTFAIVGLTLGAVALLACYIPARRATKVDPLVALRSE